MTVIVMYLGEFCREERVKERKKAADMSARFTDLIQRVTGNCLLHPLGTGRQDSPMNRVDDDTEESGSSETEYESGEEDEYSMKWVGRKNGRVVVDNRVREMEILLNEVFEAVSAMKNAYVNLQEAHSPWDPEKMKVADVLVVAELRRLGVLRERFRRGCVIGNGSGGGRRGRGGGLAVRELVAPYEAAVEELKNEVKARDVEVENLKEKLKSVAVCNSNGGKKGRFQSRKVGCINQVAPAVPVPDLFEATMMQVKEASKSFTSLLLSLMRSAHWDIIAAVRSIEAATGASDPINSSTIFATSIVTAHHAKYALESYISRKIFQGFDHETFFMDGSLSSLLNPDQHRRDCFTQYCDMKAMDPVELLGILPTCNFGKFCCKKYLSIVHPKMEESLFGDLIQYHQVSAGNHPRSQFYGEFLGLAKAIWLLHLLAFSLDPAPVHFEASRGAEFHPQYMDSLVKFSSGRVPAGQIVGFPVSPGFKLGNGAVIRARVYLVSRA